MHIVYKTTNKINNKIYVGIHTQEGNNFDGYLGSGRAKEYSKHILNRDNSPYKQGKWKGYYIVK